MSRKRTREFRNLAAVQKDVVTCTRCPRLLKFRTSVTPRRSYEGQDYWRRPVPGFGDPNAGLVIVGLAPAVHGGNRTGRVFTGDNSGRFLVRALYRAGFANQPLSESKDDGLVYTNCYLTAAVKCAPPGDKPTRSEFENCAAYLDAELGLLTRTKAILALGSMAFRSVIERERARGAETSGLKFAHGASYSLPGGRKLYASYHPSPRNTNTGVLTEGMLVQLLEKIKAGMR